MSAVQDVLDGVARIERLSTAAERGAVIYVRISSDREDGAGATLGVRRQENECRAFAAYMGMAVADVYVDNDKSAGEGKHRPGWEDMLDDIREGRVSCIIAWHFDRLTRNDTDMTRMLKLAKSHGVQVKLKTSGDIDVTTASGRLMAKQQANMAVYEVEHIAERMLAKHKQLAQDGKPNGGRRRFGYNDDMTIRASEAAIVRDLAARALAGESLTGLARWLDREGVPTIGADYDARRVARGLEPKKDRHPWRAIVVKHMLIGEHIIGARTHHGEITVADAWPAVLDVQTWQALRRMLTAADRRSSTTTARKHLLAGLIHCGNCGAPLRSAYGGAKRSGDGTRPRRYSCRECGKGRDAVALETYVTEAAIELLETIDVRGLIVKGDDADELAALSAECAEIEAALEALADKVADRAMSPDMAGRIARKSEARLAVASAARDAAEAAAADNRTRPMRVLDGITGDGARDLWAGLGFERQRAVIGLLLDVRMVPAERQGERVGTHAVEITRKRLG